MQYTLKTELIGLSGENRRELDELIARYCSAKRIAFNRILEGHRVNETTHLLLNYSSLQLNWRYCEHAAKDAEAEIESQRQLLPLYLKDAIDRIKDIKKKLAKARKSPEEVENSFVLSRRLAGFEKKRRIYEKHTLSGTIPKVVFGGRSNFQKLQKGEISRGEWKELRNNQVYSMGQANQKGNANIRILGGDHGFLIEVNFPTKLDRESRGWDGRIYRVRSRRMRFSLRVPAKFQRSVEEQVVRGGKAYSVRMVRRRGRYFAHISFGVEPNSLTHVPEAVCAVDQNPEGFAAAIIKKDGNLLAHRFFRDDRLIYASKDKRAQIVGENVRRIMEFGEKHEASAFVIESLDISGHKDFGRRVNRVIYAFVRRRFTETLFTRCWRNGVPVFTVNPAYTSMLGGAKYSGRFGLSVHEAAALVIGRRFYGYGEKLSKALMVSIGRPRERVPMRYVWASLYGYARSRDSYRAPPGRKGSRGLKLSGSGRADFTGRPACRDGTPRTSVDEGVRKGGECGGSPQATGDRGKPAPTNIVGGKVSATLSPMIRNDTQKTTPLDVPTSIQMTSTKKKSMEKKDLWGRDSNTAESMSLSDPGLRRKYLQSSI